MIVKTKSILCSSTPASVSHSNSSIFNLNVQTIQFAELEETFVDDRLFEAFIDCDRLCSELGQGYSGIAVFFCFNNCVEDNLMHI